MSNTPYTTQPPRAFWASAIAKVSPFDVSDLYRRRFEIGGLRIATAGSCFAQHIGRSLRERGYNFIDTEPPLPTLSPEQNLAFGYGIFSARYGNVYTSRQLVQLVKRAFGEYIPKETFWETNGRFYDPFRPSIEPEGFGSVEELRASRETHLASVRKMLESAQVFIFTMGLTETWLSKMDGAAYPSCPGTVAGEFDSNRCAFANLSYSEIMLEMRECLARFRSINPTIKVIITVSPVPLTATATEDHVMVATSYSKATLRAVAGDLVREYNFVDYFPSFEIINAPSMKGMFFEPNMRNVTKTGVAFAMEKFFSEHKPPTLGVAASVEPEMGHQDMKVICDEEALDALAGT